jgi:hypothetical protein
MPTKATTLVVSAEGIPYMKRLRAIGIPVKSNLRVGIQGNGIFNPLNLRA